VLAYANPDCGWLDEVVAAGSGTAVAVAAAAVAEASIVQSVRSESRSCFDLEMIRSSCCLNRLGVLRERRRDEGGAECGPSHQDDRGVEGSEVFLAGFAEEQDDLLPGAGEQPVWKWERRHRPHWENARAEKTVMVQRWESGRHVQSTADEGS
jgi:hypothetical protein